MARREYKGAAIQTTLAGGITSSSTSLSLTAYTGWPTGSFTMIIDPGLAGEEKILCTSQVSGTVTVTTRGYDNTVPSAHTAGAVCYPAPMAVDFDEANSHVNDTTTAHGLTLANVVKTTDASVVTGAMIANDTITNADIKSDAAIDWTKLGISSTVSSTEIGYVDGVTSAIQTQLDSKLPKAGGTMTGAIAMGTNKITGAGDPTSAQDVATKAYADLMIPLAQKAVADGVATLDSSGLIPTAQLPLLAITDTFVVSSQSAMLALTAQVGDVAVRTDLNKSYILKTAGASTLANWQELLTPTDSVLSVDGLTGAVDLSSSYATVANAANKLPLAGGTMSGAIAMGTNTITGRGTPSASTDAATKGYVDTITVAPSNLTGPITSSGSATSIASQTGTGTKFVVDTSPTLVTPVLGVATATSINGTTIPSTKTLVVTTDKLSVLSGTTSAELAGVISDETGSGSLVFATSPTLVTPALGTPASGTLTNTTGVPISGLVASTSAALGVGSVELGHASDTTIARVSAGVASIEGVNIVTTSSTDTLTNKTLTSPVINTPKIACTYTAKTAAYTFASGDEGNIFSMNNAASVQFNIPTDATFNFAIGTEFNVFWITGAGQPTIGAVTPGTTTVISTGGTSATPKLRVANSGATCKKLAANSWIVFGDLA